MLLSNIVSLSLLMSYVAESYILEGLAWISLIDIENMLLDLV